MALQLQEKGFTKVWALKGGWKKWELEGRPTDSTK
jgi:3-mercaptopyruvate sulfurtransferase SseA